MRNNASQISVSMAGVAFLGVLWQLFLLKTDWVVLSLCLGFCFVFLAFTICFEFMMDLESQFVQLTKILSETFIQLAKIDQQRHERSQSNVIFTFQPSGTTWNGLSEETRLNLLTLDQLEAERKQAEKEENYERAALLQRKIEQRKAL